MYVWMYKYVYLHEYTYVCMYALHVCVCLCIYMYMYVCMYVCNMYAHVHMHYLHFIYVCKLCMFPTMCEFLYVCMMEMVLCLASLLAFRPWRGRHCRDADVISHNWQTVHDKYFPVFKELISLWEDGVDGTVVDLWFGVAIHFVVQDPCRRFGKRW